MPMAANDIERLIKARIPDANVTIRDLAGDGDHYAATVISETFRGKSRVQQHQIVYEALKAIRGLYPLEQKALGGNDDAPARKHQAGEHQARQRPAEPRRAKAGAAS